MPIALGGRTVPGWVSPRMLGVLRLTDALHGGIGLVPLVRGWLDRRAVAAAILQSAGLKLILGGVTKCPTLQLKRGGAFLFNNSCSGFGAERGDAHILASLAVHVSERPEAVAYEFYRSFNVNDRAGFLSYRALQQSARVIGASIARRTAPGDRVALMFPAGLDFIQALLGVFSAGRIAVPVPVPAGFSAQDDRLASIIKDSQPSFLVTTNDRVHQLAARMREGAQPPEVAGIEALTRLTAPDPGRGEYRSDDVAFLQYTSGSTGEPKGVEVSHANLWANVNLIQESLRGGPETPVIGWLPHTHDMGLVGHLLWSLHAGAPCAIVPPMEFAKRPAKWIKMISDGKYAGTAAPNSAYEIAARLYQRERGEDLDLSAWRIALNGAEPIAASTLHRFERTFGHAGFDAAAFVPAYGLAEATLFVTCSLPGEKVAMRRVDPEALWTGRVLESSGDTAIELVSSGTVAGRGITIRDDDGSTLPDGRVGRIFVEGGHVTPRYWGGAETRKELDTGDLGFILEGELYVTGRVKDLIILNGRNIAPHDVERVIASIVPLARPDGAIVHQPSSNGDDRVFVFIELRREHATTSRLAAHESSLQEVLLERFAIPKVTVIPIRPGAAPRTTSGKVQRARTHRMYRDGRIEAITSRDLAPATT